MNSVVGLALVPIPVKKKIVMNIFFKVKKYIKAPGIEFFLEKIVMSENFLRNLIGCLEDWELEKTD